MITAQEARDISNTYINKDIQDELKRIEVLITRATSNGKRSITIEDKPLLSSVKAQLGRLGYNIDITSSQHQQYYGTTISW